MKTCMNGTCGYCPQCIADKRHDDYLDGRSCEIASILIRRGRDPKRAYEVGSRFSEIEFKKLIRWD